MLSGRTDTEAEVTVFWSSDVYSQVTGKSLLLGSEGRKSPGLCAQSLRFPRREAGLQAESQESPSSLQQMGPRSGPLSLLLMGSIGGEEKGHGCASRGLLPNPGGSPRICLVSHAPF